MIPVQFFQAAGTAIPALFIAIVVGLRFGRELETRTKAGGRSGSLAMILLLVIASIMLSGEFVALITLTEGEGTDLEAFWVMAAVIVALVVLAIEMLGPVVREIGSRPWGVATMIVLAAAVVVSLLVSIIVILGT